MGQRLAQRGASVLLTLALAAGCGGGGAADNSAPPPITSGVPGFVKGFLGGVVADEPNAALVGREVLSAGGTAGDAAVAIGFALAVTLPSRAGLGGGGGCLAYTPRAEKPEDRVPQAVLFLPQPPASPAGADRPAAVPMLARGLYALHAKYGTRRFESLMAPAEQMARTGVTVSRGLAHDLTVVAAPLAADAGARSVFFSKGAPLTEGARLLQPGLGATIAQMRRVGIGDLYQGALAHTLADAARDIGAGLSVDDLRHALPSVVPPLSVPDGAVTLAFLPLPADGGLATAAAFAGLAADPATAGARGLAAAARWRQGGGDAKAILAASSLPPANLPPLPASSTFAAMDRVGNVVVCAVTMNNLFGTGRMAAGTGMVLAASPKAVPAPLLAAALAYEPKRRVFRAAVGGSGQDGAPLAAALALRTALTGSVDVPASPEPGRANVIACGGGLPGAAKSCAWRADPRGSGMAVGSSR